MGTVASGRKRHRRRERIPTAAAGSGGCGSAIDVDIEDDTLLPSQYLDRIVCEPSLQPEKRLMLAVLESAVAAYQKYARSSSRRGRRLFDEATAWLADETDSWVFSFESICGALALNAGFVRDGLERWRQQQRGPMPDRYPFRRVSGTRHKVSSDCRRRAAAGGNGIRALAVDQRSPGRSP